MLLASAAASGNELEKGTVHVPFLGTTEVTCSPVAGAATLHSTIAAPRSTFLFSHNLGEKDGGGKGREGPEIRALLKMQPHH